MSVPRFVDENEYVLPYENKTVPLPYGYSSIVQDICPSCRKFQHLCAGKQVCFCDICQRANFRRRAREDAAKAGNVTKYWFDPKTVTEVAHRG